MEEGGGLLRRLVAGWIVTFGLVVGSARAAELRGAVGLVDITPPLRVQLGGYEELRPDRPAKGVRDPLTARILVLSDGVHFVALVAADLIGTFATREMEQLRSKVKADAGIDWLLFAVSHTHSAPAMHEEYPEGKFPDWEQEAIRKIAGGIAERSEERRVGEEGRSRWAPDHLKK